jgi:TPR repeat protein
MVELEKVEFITSKIENIEFGYCIGNLVGETAPNIKSSEKFDSLLNELKINNPKAIFQLGTYYENGCYYYLDKYQIRVISIVKNTSTAFEIYKLAESKGSIDACHKLGEIFISRGDKANFEIAKSYLIKSSELNNIESLYLLGIIENLNKNFKLAYEIFRKSADLGHVNSCFVVAHAFHYGNKIWEKNNFMALSYAKIGFENNPDDLELKQLFKKINKEIFQE